MSLIYSMTFAMVCSFEFAPCNLKFTHDFPELGSEYYLSSARQMYGSCISEVLVWQDFMFACGQVCLRVLSQTILSQFMLILMGIVSRVWLVPRTGPAGSRTTCKKVEASSIFSYIW